MPSGFTRTRWHRGERGHDGLKWVGRFLGDQALLLSPLVFLTYLYTLYDGARRGAKERDDAYLFLWCPSLLAFASTLAVTALRSKVEGNWAVDAYVTGVILSRRCAWCECGNEAGPDGFG